MAALTAQITCEPAHVGEVKRGPVSVKMLQRIQDLEDNQTKMMGLISTIMTEQQHLTELISLSAAASGMIAGELQLKNLGDRLVSRIEQTLERSLPRYERERSEGGQSAVRRVS